MDSYLYIIFGKVRLKVSEKNHFVDERRLMTTDDGCSGHDNTCSSAGRVRTENKYELMPK